MGFAVSADSDFLRFQFNSALAAEAPGRFGVACSGGGDSLATLRLAAGYARDNGVELHCITVDHGLRTGSDQEASDVADICQGLGISHEIARWINWDGQGNLQDEARRARYGLIADWAHGLDLDLVCLGHTADDQAETVLMQIARSAGVDGLAAMAPKRDHLGVTWLRPLLQTRRDALRDYLREEGQSWIDDPSNEDERYDRIKARNILEALKPLGVSPEKLCTLAGNMADARHALNQQVWHFAGDVALVQEGDVLLHRDNLMRGHFETRRRLLRHALTWVSASDYGPRQREIMNLFKAIKEERTATLCGCLIAQENDRIRISREYSAVSSLQTGAGDLWDNRWRLRPEDGDATGVTIRALGEEGLQLCHDWRETGLSRASLIALPAAFRGEALLAAPLAGLTNGWMAENACGEKDFFNSLVSH